MTKPVRMIVVLGLVSLLSGASLVFVYEYATPLIEANQKKALEEAIFNVVPGAVKYEEVTKEGEAFFKVYNKGNTLLGYAFTAEGNGYQGNIAIIAGIEKDLTTLSGIEILESAETPGLGGEINERGFKDQFVGLMCTPMIECIKQQREKGNQIQAITGATISSQSVVDILNEKIARIREIINK